MSDTPRKRIRYRQLAPADDSGWSEWERPVHNGYRLLCCDCGLFHNVNFRVRRRMVEMQFQLNRRATAAVRRGNRYAVSGKPIDAKRG